MITFLLILPMTFGMSEVYKDLLDSCSRDQESDQCTSTTWLVITIINFQQRPQNVP